jgi:hypothetical protein
MGVVRTTSKFRNLWGASSAKLAFIALVSLVAVFGLLQFRQRPKASGPDGNSPPMSKVVASPTADASPTNMEHRGSTDPKVFPAQQILITYKDDTPQSERSHVRDKVSVRLVRTADTPFTKMDVVVPKNPKQASVSKTLRELDANQHVEFAQVEHVYYPAQNR